MELVGQPRYSGSRSRDPNSFCSKGYPRAGFVDRRHHLLQLPDSKACSQDQGRRRGQWGFEYCRFVEGHADRPSPLLVRPGLLGSWWECVCSDVCTLFSPSQSFLRLGTHSLAMDQDPLVGFCSSGSSLSERGGSPEEASELGPGSC